MPSPRDPKYVVANQPVNRRTAPRPAAAPPAVAPVARERMLAAQSRQRLGAPLAEQLVRPPTARQPLSPFAISGGVVAAAGAVALLLAALQGTWALAAGGAVATAAGTATAWRFRRQPDPLAGLEAAAAAPLLEPEAVAAFDRALEALAPEVPPGIAQQLADLKQLLARIARHPAAARADEHFSFDDRMYVAECVRRYLPDSLQAFLAVPAAQRDVAVAGGQTPQELLAAQLQLLRDGLRQREEKLARSAAEGLLQQERFLATKNRRP